MTQAEYSRHRNWHRSYTARLVKSGRIKLNERGKIDPELADAEIEKTRHPAYKRSADKPVEKPDRLPIRGASPEVLDFQVARTLRENYLARREQLEYKKEQGELIEREMVARALTTAAVMVRDAILGVPRRLSAELSACTDARVIEDRLDLELSKALEHFVAQALAKISH